MRFDLWQLMVLVLYSLFLTACGSEVMGIDNVAINVQETTIIAGEQRPLSVNVVGPADIQFEWSTTTGTLSSTSSQSVIFTAPDTPGPVIVDIRVISGDQIVTDSITFDVIAPDPTETPTPEPSSTPEPSPTQTQTSLPTDVPTATPIPPPVACSNRAIAPNVFPQLAEDIQNSFAGSEPDEGFECFGVYDQVHTLREFAIAVKLRFEASESRFAWFGMTVPDGYDVTDFNEICLWVYSETPNQVFKIQMKDTQESLFSSEVVHEQPSEWIEHCRNFDTFSSDTSSSLKQNTCQITWDISAPPALISLETL